MLVPRWPEAPQRGPQEPTGTRQRGLGPEGSNSFLVYREREAKAGQLRRGLCGPRGLPCENRQGTGGTERRERARRGAVGAEVRV